MNMRKHRGAPPGNTFALKHGLRTAERRADARRDNSPVSGVITLSKSLLHIRQQNYKMKGGGIFPPPCLFTSIRAYFRILLGRFRASSG